MDALRFVSQPETNPSSGDEADYIEVPSFLESLANSVSQLEELAELTSTYYIRGLISYGYIHEPKRGGDEGQGEEGVFNRVPLSVSSEAKKKNSINTITTNDNDLALNKNDLESMSSLVDFLPFLNDLSGHIEKCFTTIELTFRRFNYHLNKLHSLATNLGGQKSASSKNEFKPPIESRFDPIFVAIMDLLFAFISLDETIKSHTNIKQSIQTLKQSITRQQVVTSSNPDQKAGGGESSPNEANLGADKLKQLVQLIVNIESTICNEKRSIFHQCLEHLQHLDLILNSNNNNKFTSNKEKLQSIKNISEHLNDFIVFYAENLSQDQLSSSSLIPSSSGNLKSSHDISFYLLLQSKMVPTKFMTSLERKVLGLSSLHILNCWIFKRFNDKRLTKVFNRMLTTSKFKQINLINLAESNIFITLSDFLLEYLPTSSYSSKTILDSKTLNHLRGQEDQLLSSDLRQYSNEMSLEVMSLLANLKATCANQTLQTADRNLQILLEKSIALIEEINTTIRSTISVHLKHKKPITRNNLIHLLRAVALLKSIHVALMHDHRTTIIHYQMNRDRLLRCRWRKLMLSARKRSITSKYSEQKLNSQTSLILFGICSNLIDRLVTDNSRSLLFMAISMLSLACFNEQELNELSVLLLQMRPDIYERLEQSSNCSYLYWNVPNFSAYYNYVFEEDSGNIREINYFHHAINDMRRLFSFDNIATTGSESLSLLKPKHNGDDNNSNSSNRLDWLVEKRNLFVERLADELMDQFKIHTLDKICQELEIELRLQTHRDLHHLDGHDNPFRGNMYNFKRIFATSLTGSDQQAQQPFSILGRSIALNQYVEQHLSEIYYNLTSIAPHDWFSYDCMINLARQKYGLHLIDSQMPTQTIDCGIDLMEITRNLALFVSKYSYDMSNQLFIEKCSNRFSSTSSASASVISGSQTHSMLNNMAANQSLNVVQIRHVSMSIQNHGFGLLNSAINCTYQLMKRLINLIAQQTHNDQLRAILTKQHQQLSSCLIESGISFDRALKLARKFKINHQDSIDSAIAAAGESRELINVAPVDLDQIRQLLTQLGNALAFMRLLKSGALNCASKSVDYLPDLDDTSLLRLKKFVQSEFYRSSNKSQAGSTSDSLLEAANNFDTCLEDLGENFSPKTDYFSIVLNLFSGALNNDREKVHREDKESHEDGEISGDNLGESTDKRPIPTGNGQREVKIRKGDRFNLFYLLIPSLTINYIDYIINAKERVVSRSSASRVGAVICDDGFSMGVAFLLIVLKQTKEFAKLDWFKEVRTKLETDQAEVEKRIGNSKQEESLKQTSSMTLRRLMRLKQEYDGLDYNLKSALLLLRSSTMTQQTKC